MGKLITFLNSAVFITGSFLCSAQDLVNYTLDANEQIIGCNVTALNNSNEVGKIESIDGSFLNLRINPLESYKITINNDKTYYLRYENYLGFIETNIYEPQRNRSITSASFYANENGSSSTGLQYRVQIGAFSKEVPKKTFSSIGQVYTEKIEGGITRYMIGSFPSGEEAEKAAAVLREMGYSNAFIVACYNGKRISFQMAQSMENEAPPSISYSQHTSF